jgi:hypothetical protein
VLLEFLQREGFAVSELADIEEELDDMEVSGGRLLDTAAVLLEAVHRSDCGFVRDGLVGDESVKSSSSSSFCAVRSSGGAGIGAV